MKSRKDKTLLIVGVSFFLACLSGCTDLSYDVKVQESIEFQSDEIDACSLITEVDGQTIKDHYRDKQKISFKDYNVHCPIVNIRKLGKHEATIQVNGNNQIINFEVKDTTAPTIEAAGEYKVEEQNPYFAIEKMVKVKDTYDHDPIIGFVGDYDLKVPGTYEVTIQAKDASKNTSSKKVKIVVSKKVIQIIENVTVIDNSNNESKQSNNQQPQPSTPIPSGLPRKVFSVEEGYDMNTAFSACKGYRGSNAGACTPFNKLNGLFGGYVYEP